jgi:formate-nitrite transporter family protein
VGHRAGREPGCALIFAILMHGIAHFQPDIGVAMNGLGGKVYHSNFTATLSNSLFAGWLIALIVWLLPAAESGRVTIIIIVTYVVGLGGFSHIIAGSVHAFYVLLDGQATLGSFFITFLIPTLLGNITGGVAFMAAINHGLCHLFIRKMTGGKPAF